jgi:hypothetical protein
VSDGEWPPPEARARAALWGAERHLTRAEYVAAATALDGALTSDDPNAAAVARGLRQLAVAGYRHQTGDAIRAQRHLSLARTRLSPFLPVFEELDLVGILEVVAASLET